MVFNATFNNISVISWLSVLFVEDTGVTTDLPELTDKLIDIEIPFQIRAQHFYFCSVSFSQNEDFNDENTLLCIKLSVRRSFKTLCRSK